MEQKPNKASHSFKEYKVRAGTVNYGREYEFKTAALLSLRCISEGVKDMWLAVNLDNVGAFDDVVLGVEQWNNKTKTYMLQLKHQNVPKNITKKDFLLTKGDFSLVKYFKDINSLHELIKFPSEDDVVNDIIKSDEIYFVLFTNRGVSNECTFLESEPDSIQLLNIGDDASFKFLNIKLADGTCLNHVNKHNNLYLLPNQVGVKHIDREIQAMIQKIIKRQINIQSIAEHFVKFITNWATGDLGGYYCLKKQDILYKLTQLVLCQFEINLNDEPFEYYECNKKLIWNDILQDKVITLVDSSEAMKDFLIQYVGSEIIKYCKLSIKLWGDALSRKQKEAFYHNDKTLEAYILQTIGNSGAISVVDVYRGLWRMGCIPLLLIIKSKSDYKHIQNVLRLSNYAYKVILVNEGIQLPARKKGDAKRFETLSNIEEANKTKILQQSVKLQGRQGVVLSELLEPDMYKYVTCSDLIKILTNDFNIGNDLVSLPVYFIQRTIVKTVLHNRILQKYTEDIFVITKHADERYNETMFDDYPVYPLEELNLNDLEKRPSLLLTEDSITSEQIEKLKRLQKPIHLLGIYNKNFFEWKWSHGSLQNIHDFQVKLELELENNLDNFLKGTTVVSAPPGMGKTVLGNYLTHRLPTYMWVLQIDLNKHQSYFRHEDCKSLSTDAVKHLWYFYDTILQNTNDSLSIAVFQKFVNRKRVIVLMDGFDEVSVSYKVQATNIGQSFVTHGYKVCIMTRPVMENHLQDIFKTACVTLKTFTRENQETFLINYFDAYTDSNLSSKMEIITKFAKELLKAVRANLNDRDAEFTGIPLQTKLLAHVFSEECNKSIRNKVISFNINFDLLYLYQNFIESKIKIFLDKFGETGYDLYEMVKEHQSLFALKLIFPFDNFNDTEIIKKLEDFYKNQPTRIHLLQRQGIITIDENLNITCTHRTFAEFLAAEWLAMNINNEDKQLQNFVFNLVQKRFSKDYQFLFKIFDRILIKDCELHSVITTGKLDKTIHLINSNPNCVNTIDRGQRSVLHLIALYDYRYLHPHQPIISQQTSMSLIVDTILQDFTMSRQVDLMGYTPLDYAIANYSLRTADQLSIKLPKLTVNVYISLDLERGFFNCCLYYYPHVFHKLLIYFGSRNILSNKINKNVSVADYIDQYSNCNYYKEYLNIHGNKTMLELVQSQCLTIGDSDNYLDMRYAVAFGSESNVQKLLHAGVDVNEQDIDKCTLIHYAVLHERTEIVKILLNHGVDINLKDRDNNTPLHLACSKNNDKIICLLLSGGTNSHLNSKNIYGNTPLHMSVFRNSKSIINLLTSKGADLNAKNNKGNIPLHFSISQHFMKITKLLIIKGTNLNITNENGNTPLNFAVDKSQVDTAHLLIFHGANLNIPNQDGNIALHMALQRGCTDLVDLLIKKGTNINTVNKCGNTPLHLALLHKHKRSAWLLIDAGASLNIVNNIGFPPLHLALQKTYEDIASALITKGANVNVVNKEGNSPLHLALQQGYKAIVNSLITKDVNLNLTNKEGDTATHLALRQDCEDMVALLISKRPNLTIPDCNGNTLLHLAAQNGYKDIVNLLIVMGTIVNVQNKDGDTALHLALSCKYENYPQTLTNNINASLKVQNCYENIAKLLILKGMDFDIKNDKGDTPLHLAVLNGFESIASLLIIKGAKINAQNNSGDAPIHQAAKCDLHNIAEYFFAKQVDVNVMNKNGNTPIHTAAEHGSTGIISFFINQGFNTDNKNKEGNTPLYLAVRNSHQTIAELLIKNGADVMIKPENQDTLLHIVAIKNENENLVNLLITRGIKINSKNKSGDTPLHEVSRYNSINITRLLIANGADVNANNKNMNTPFNLAVWYGHDDIANLLIDEGAKIYIADRNGDIPLHQATRQRCAKIVEKLLFKGSEINAQNNCGDTPLHIAVQNGYSYITRLLVGAGADINTKNKKDETPLRIAKCYNYDNIGLYHYLMFTPISN